MPFVLSRLGEHAGRGFRFLRPEDSKQQVVLFSSKSVAEDMIAERGLVGQAEAIRITIKEAVEYLREEREDGVRWFLYCRSVSEPSQSLTIDQAILKLDMGVQELEERGTAEDQPLN
jgi:hypothetical protein